MIDLKLMELCRHTVDIQMDRIQYLCRINKMQDAESIYNEFREWIVDETDHNIFYLDFLNDQFDNN